MARDHTRRWQNWTAIGRPLNTSSPPRPAPHECRECTLRFHIVMEREDICPDCHITELRGEAVRDALQRLAEMDRDEVERIRSVRLHAIRQRITSAPQRRLLPGKSPPSRAERLARKARGATARDEAMRTPRR